MVGKDGSFVDSTSNLHHAPLRSQGMGHQLELAPASHHLIGSRGPVYRPNDVRYELHGPVSYSPSGSADEDLSYGHYQAASGTPRADSPGPQHQRGYGPRVNYQGHHAASLPPHRAAASASASAGEPRHALASSSNNYGVGGGSARDLTALRSGYGPASPQFTGSSTHQAVYGSDAVLMAGASKMGGAILGNGAGNGYADHGQQQQQPPQQQLLQRNHRSAAPTAESLAFLSELGDVRDPELWGSFDEIGPWNNSAASNGSASASNGSASPQLLRQQQQLQQHQQQQQQVLQAQAHLSSSGSREALLACGGKSDSAGSRSDTLGSAEEDSNDEKEKDTGVAARRRRQKQQLMSRESDLTAEEKLDRSRERNRDHSRRSRQRKKVFVEGLKKQVTDLGAYRMLVEKVQDLVSVHSADDMAVFLYASSGFGRSLGLDPRELLGLQLALLVHPEDVAHVAQHVHAVLARGEVSQVRYRIRRQHRRTQSVETSFRLVPNRIIAITRLGPVVAE